MRDSIGGAWLLGIVLVFMSVFIAYIAITINYSNAFNMKTNMITIIEQYDGINPNSLAKIDSLMQGYNYRIKSKCPVPEDNSTYIGVTDQIVTKNPTDRQSYCVYRERRDGEDGAENKYYYNLIVFFNFSLPVLGDLFTFQISSETNVIYYPNDPYF